MQDLRLASVFLVPFWGGDFRTSEGKVFSHKIYLFQQVAQADGLDEFSPRMHLHGRILFEATIIHLYYCKTEWSSTTGCEKPLFMRGGTLG